MKSSLYGAQGPSQTQAGACSPARTQLFHLPPSKTHLLSPTTCFHVTFNICKRLWQVRLFQPDAQGILSTCGHSHLTVSYWVSKIYKSVESIQQDYYWERKKKNQKKTCRRVITTVCWCFWVIYSAKMLTVCSFHGFHFSLKEMFYFLSFFLFF